MAQKLSKVNWIYFFRRRLFWATFHVTPGIWKLEYTRNGNGVGWNSSFDVMQTDFVYDFLIIYVLQVFKFNFLWQLQSSYVTFSSI